MKKLMLKTVLRYVTLNPLGVNDDAVFLFTFYKHRRKQISAVILKPNIEVTSSTRYLCDKFSVVRQLRSWVYLRTNLLFFVRKKVF